MPECDRRQLENDRAVTFSSRHSLEAPHRPWASPGTRPLATCVCLGHSCKDANGDNRLQPRRAENNGRVPPATDHLGERLSVAAVRKKNGKVYLNRNGSLISAISIARKRTE